MLAKLCGIEQRAPPIFGRAAITLALAHIFSFISLLYSVQYVTYIMQILQ